MFFFWILEWNLEQMFCLVIFFLCVWMVVRILFCWVVYFEWRILFVMCVVDWYYFLVSVIVFSRCGICMIFWCFDMVSRMVIFIIELFMCDVVGSSILDSLCWLVVLYSFYLVFWSWFQVGLLKGIMMVLFGLVFFIQKVCIVNRLFSSFWCIMLLVGVCLLNCLVNMVFLVIGGGLVFVMRNWVRWLDWQLLMVRCLVIC